jgi:hypothetical protein
MLKVIVPSWQTALRPGQRERGAARGRPSAAPRGSAELDGNARRVGRLAALNRTPMDSPTSRSRSAGELDLLADGKSFGDDEAPAALDAAPAAGGEAAAADDETEILVLSREAAAYLYGRGGNTMRRLADFSGCVIEMHMTKNTVEIKGSEYSRELAKLCVRVTMAQRGNHLGTLDFEEIAARCDCATVDVPTSAVGFGAGQG